MDYNVWSMLHYLQHENNLLKEKYNQLHELLGEVIEAVKTDAKQRFEQKVKNEKRCKYQNRGFCKEGSSCVFVHYNEVCSEHKSSGSCPQERICPFRHPNRCNYWSNGFCWRGPDCVYLHNPEDKDSAEIHEHENEQEEMYDVIDEDEEEHESVGTINEHDHEMCETVEITNENDNFQITTDEILKMYENVAELDDINDDVQITTEEILKMYESESESCARESDFIQKTTRKRKKTITHGK